MNNKGFAISTMLYGTFLLFLMLMLAMLGILKTFKDNMDILIDGNNGARDIVEKKCGDFVKDTNGNGKYELIDQDGDGIYELNDADGDGKIDIDERVDKTLGLTEFKLVLKLCDYTKG